MPKIGPIQTSVLQFEDVHGNKLSDTEYHMWVQTQLLGGVDKDYYDAFGDDPFRN